MKKHNKIFFSLVNYALSEDYSCNWAFKTSLLTPSGVNEDLSQNNYIAIDKTASIQQFFNEIKPYHCQFTIQQDKYNIPTELCQIGITDNVITNISIRFDRKSCNHDMDAGFDTLPFDTDTFDYYSPNSNDYNNAINRIYLDSDSNLDNASNILGCGFKGYTFDGDVFKTFGFDNYDQMVFDSPHYHNYYYITDGTTIEPDISVENTYEKYETKPLNTVIFDIPKVPFNTKRIEVYSELPYGSNRTKITDYTINNDGTITLITPPTDFSTIIVSVLNYDKICDTILTNQNWNSIITPQLNVDCSGFIRPLWEKNHPEELYINKISDTINIKSEILNIPSYNNDYGYDILAYDTSGYDEVDIDTTNTCPTLYHEDISIIKSLKKYPVNENGILLFEDGLLINPDNYNVIWNDVANDDKNQPVIIDYANAGTLSALYFDYGGTLTAQYIERNTWNNPVFILNQSITDNNFVYAMVDGQIATFTIDNNILTITNPVLNNSCVRIYIGLTDESCICYKQKTLLNNLFTLTTPPSSDDKILIFDSTTGKQIYSYYYKKYIVSSFTDTFKSYLPVAFLGTYEIYLNNTLLVEGADYTLSADKIITLSSTPSFNDILEIYGYGEELYSLSGDTLTTTIGRALNIITFDNDININSIIETCMGDTSSMFELSQSLSNSNMILSLDGVLLTKNKDYTIQDKYITFNVSTNNKVIQIMYFLNEVYNHTIFTNKYIDNSFINNKQYNIQRTSLLASDVELIDDTIDILNVYCLPKPNILQKIPGIIKINNEIISYWQIDYENNRLMDITRGYLNTCISNHYENDTVIDYSNYYNESKIKKPEWKSYNHLVENAILNYKYSIPKKIKNDDMIYIKARYPLIIDGTKSTTQYLHINDVTCVNRPGQTGIKSTKPVTLLDTSGVLQFIIQDKYIYNISINSTDINDLITAINTDTYLNQFEINALTTTNIVEGVPILSFSIYMGVGGSLVLKNRTNYPLLELFGGESTGSIENPTVIVDGVNGLIIDDIKVIFTGAGTLTTIIDDINNANIPNIIARNKSNRLQLINTNGQSITIEPEPSLPDDYSTGAIGIYSTTQSIVSKINNELHVVCDISNTKGNININSDNITFDYIDNNDINNPKIYNYISQNNNTYLSDIYNTNGYKEITLSSNDYYIQSNAIYLKNILPINTILTILIA